MTKENGTRERVLDALQRIIAERGLDQVSIREVAAAAGVSIGTVQYYCRSKEEMLRIAYERVADEIIRRATTVDPAGTVGQVLRRGLLQLLPLDGPRRTESLVYLAFAARACVTPWLAQLQHAKLAEFRTRCASALRRAQESGEAPPGLDVEAAAATIAALVDGLLLHTLTDPAGLPPEAAVTALDTYLSGFLDLQH